MSDPRYALVRYSGCSVRGRHQLLPHVLQGGPANGGVLLRLHLPVEPHMEGDEGVQGRLREGKSSYPHTWQYGENLHMNFHFGGKGNNE